MLNATDLPTVVSCHARTLANAGHTSRIAVTQRDPRLTGVPRPNLTSPTGLPLWLEPNPALDVVVA